MTEFSKIDMGEVTRLTREGRLDEAMAMLKGSAVRGFAPSAVGILDDGVAGHRDEPRLRGEKGRVRRRLSTPTPTHGVGQGGVYSVASRP